MIIRTKNILLALALTVCSMQAARTDITSYNRCKCSFIKSLNNNAFATILAEKLTRWQDNDGLNRLNKLEKIVQKESANFLTRKVENKLQRLCTNQEKPLLRLIKASSKIYARFFVQRAKDFGFEYSIENKRFTPDAKEAFDFVKKCIDSVSKKFPNMLEIETQNNENNEIEIETPRHNRKRTCPGTPCSDRRMEPVTPHIDGDNFTDRICPDAPKRN